MRRTARRRVRPALLTALAAAVVLPFGAVAPAQARTPDPGPAGADESVVTPEAAEWLESPPEAPADAAPANGAVAAIVETDDGLEVVTVDAGPGELDEVEADLEREPEVLDVVDVFVDVPARISATPNDEWRFDQWALDALQYDDDLVSAAPDGSEKIVAVVDTGVLASHPDLAGRVNCGLGADFTGEVVDGDGCIDPSGHGTHVAGTISAVADNGIGIAGLSAAQIMPVRVLDADGNGMSSDITAGMFWAVDHGADVINLSLGSEQTTAYDAAVEYALDHDVVVVAAAGNNRQQGNTPQSPATTRGVISVAATDRLDQSASFSYSGPTNFISAPGEYVLSTIPDEEDVSGYGYAYGDGTSMAAPHVSGVVARYRELHPSASVLDVRKAIRDTATDLQDPGFDDDTGHGLIDMWELMTDPGAPTIGTPTAGDEAARAKWSAPAVSGASPITGYVIKAYRGSTMVKRLTAPASAREVRFSGLVNGRSHTFVVWAVNAAGTSRPSARSSAFTTFGVPGAPGIGRANAGDGAARARWSAPSSNGSPITTYVIKAYRGSTMVKRLEAPASAREVRFSGLRNGKAHTFVVWAVNARGTSSPSKRSAAVTPQG